MDFNEDVMKQGFGKFILPYNVAKWLCYDN